MTTRIKGFTITLEKDLREDDIEELVTALRMVRGVASVDPLEKGTEDDMARARVYYELRDKFYEFINKELKLNG
jgi:hypothetical protein